MKKRFSTCVAALALLLAFAVGPAPAEPARPLVRLTLLQLNDVYQTAPVDGGARGGLARVGTLVKQIRATTPNTLFVMAGDTISPSTGTRVFKGAQMIAAWNALGLDYATLGNHEFDLGLAVLNDRINESRFPWICANVVSKTTGKAMPGLRPYAIVERDGVKVGVFGLVTTESARLLKGPTDIAFLDPVSTARPIVAQLRKEGAQVIVALTHLSLAQDKALAAALPDIDVICGGHEHTLLQSLVGRTPILKAASDARNLGRIDIYYDRARRRVDSLDIEFIPVNATIADDPAVAAVTAQYDARLKAEFGRPVGRAAVPLEARRAVNRRRESNLSNFVADAFRASVGADVAISNAGGMRGDALVAAGPLTLADVVSLLPYGNTIVKLEVKGKTLREALENGLGGPPDAESRAFPQISGMRVTYDRRKPEGHRVLQVMVADKPLDDTARYTLATNSFMFDGGSGYDMLKSANVLIGPDEGPLDTDVVSNAISARGEIAPKTDGRLTPVTGENPVGK